MWSAKKCRNSLETRSKVIIGNEPISPSKAMTPPCLRRGVLCGWTVGRYPSRIQSGHRDQHRRVDRPVRFSGAGIRYPTERGLYPNRSQGHFGSAQSTTRTRRTSIPSTCGNCFRPDSSSPPRVIVGRKRRRGCDGLLAALPTGWGFERADEGDAEIMSITDREVQNGKFCQSKDPWHFRAGSDCNSPGRVRIDQAGEGCRSGRFPGGLFDAPGRGQGRGA